MDRRFGVPVNPSQSPDDVRICSFDVEPYPDGRRLRCTLEITDFNVPPDAEIIIEDHEGHAVASGSIVGLVNSTAMFAVHIHEPAQARSYTARVSLTYPDEGLVDQKEIGFSIPHASTDAGE